MKWRRLVCQGTSGAQKAAVNLAQRKGLQPLPPLLGAATALQQRTVHTFTYAEFECF